MHVQLCGASRNWKKLAGSFVSRKGSAPLQPVGLNGTLTNPVLLTLNFERIQYWLCPADCNISKSLHAHLCPVTHYLNAGVLPFDGSIVGRHQITDGADQGQAADSLQDILAEKTQESPISSIVTGWFYLSEILYVALTSVRPFLSSKGGHISGLQTGLAHR